MATALPGAGKTAKYGDLKKRLLFLLGALFVFRIGAHIPVPGIDPNVLAELFKGQQGGILGMFNMFSGGALSRFTIFALGIMPYISASIIMQLMTAGARSWTSCARKARPAAARSRSTRATAPCSSRYSRPPASRSRSSRSPAWCSTPACCSG